MYFFRKLANFNQIQPYFEDAIAFLRTAAKINNKSTLKVCRKITKITHPNSGFFLGDGGIQGWNSHPNFWNYRFKSIFTDINCLLSIIIDKKNLRFLPTCMKSKCGPLSRLRLPFLSREGTLLSACLPIHYQTALSFYLLYGVLE